MEKIYKLTKEPYFNNDGFICHFIFKRMPIFNEQEMIEKIRKSSDQLIGNDVIDKFTNIKIDKDLNLSYSKNLNIKKIDDVFYEVSYDDIIIETNVSEIDKVLKNGFFNKLLRRKKSIIKDISTKKTIIERKYYTSKVEELPLEDYNLTKVFG